MSSSFTNFTLSKEKLIRAVTKLTELKINSNGTIKQIQRKVIIIFVIFALHYSLYREFEYEAVFLDHQYKI